MHYKNGKEARVGDFVVGTCYNTPGIVAGQIVSINEGSTTCNCTVAFVGTAATPVKQDFSQCDALYLAADAHAALEATMAASTPAPAPPGGGPDVGVPAGDVKA
jgi:hypothetical protein